MPNTCRKALRKSWMKKRELLSSWIILSSVRNLPGSKYIFHRRVWPLHQCHPLLGLPKASLIYGRDPQGRLPARFFNRVKAGTYSSIKRCFITGVSPVTMDDLTSGFNIGTNYSPHRNSTQWWVSLRTKSAKCWPLFYQSSFHHTVDELIELMKPWYDNYCFAQECYETNLVQLNMVLYFVKNYIDGNGKAPQNMIESNIRIDYEKLRMLIRKDKEFAHDASIIQTLVSQGYHRRAERRFPSRQHHQIPTISWAALLLRHAHRERNAYKGKTKLIIPNQVVRNNSILICWIHTMKPTSVSSNHEKDELSSALYIDGGTGNLTSTTLPIAWNATPRSATSRKESPSYLSFTLAMTAQNRFYRPISEADTQSGYVDIFPSCWRRSWHEP